MNIDNIYFCAIYVKTKIEYLPNMDTFHRGKFVKATYVYKDMLSSYRDLFTNEKYHSNKDICNLEIGELFINFESGFIPLRYKLNISETNMSKKKILKKLNEINSENTNE